MTRRFALPSFYQVTVSVLLGLVAAWLFGFFVFFSIVAAQKPENPNLVTDIAVVLTGGTGRVEAGFDVMAKGQAKALLISGVHPDVTLRNLVDLWDADQAQKGQILGHCCISIGYAADTTESNARETYAFVTGKPVTTIRLITSDYHMPRAWILFKRAFPDKTLVLLPVAGTSHTSAAFWRNLVVEYTKTLLTWMS